MYKNKNVFFLHLHHSCYIDFMPGHSQIKDKILQEANKLFFEKGYRKVTVDEIASNLSISKKTIYKYYQSKKDLLDDTFGFWKSRLTAEIDQILDRDDLSFIDKLQEIMSHIGVALGRLNSDLITEIQENVPDLWKKIIQYKHEAAFLRFNRLIEEGITKGQIKKSINKNLVVALYACAIDNLLDPKFLNTLPAEMRKKLPTFHSEIFDNTLKIIYEGILTEEAITSMNSKEPD